MAFDQEIERRRFIVGIGVSEYDDATLNLAAVPGDVQTITDWFANRSPIPHQRALEELASSPTHGEIRTKLSKWLKGCGPEDVVVIYIAAHGELYANIAYILGRDSPRDGLAGGAITGAELGAIIGQAKPHNVLVIVDACVAGKLGSAIQRMAEDTADELNTRNPRPPWAQVVLCSTFARDAASDGCFAEAFLSVVSQERWTGTSQQWIYMDPLMTGLNHELSVLNVPQVAEHKVWGPGAAELIPNPNYGARRLGALFADEELATHFDPASRGVSAGEAGWYFTGRHKELAQIVKWLRKRTSGDKPFVITGSPGSGKSALVSRLVALSDGSRRERLPDLSSLPPGTVPPVDSINAVVWCHNKTADQIVTDLSNRLGFNAKTADELLAAVETETRPVSIVVDALDEAVEGEAPKIASDVIRPLAMKPGVKVIVATRRHPVRTGEGSAEQKDLLTQLGVRTRDSNCLVLDSAKDGVSDMRTYIAARLMASPEPDRKTPYGSDPALAEQLAKRIADAAGTSFLVAAVTARSFALQDNGVNPDMEKLDLPSEAGAALGRYIDRLPNPAVAIDILRPLAWAEGAGLPWGPLWAPIAGALANAVAPSRPAHVYADDIVAQVLDWAGDLLVETLEDGEPAYRLFHEALAEHLRHSLAPEVAHAAISAAIEATVNPTSYESAHPYALAHLTTHLARAAGKFQRLYDLVTDPEWERAKRLRFGDSTRFLRDVDLTVAAALQQHSEPNEFLVGACIVYGRMMAVAPAIVVGVIARAGQVQRAELMANNIEFAVDRCLAYTLLAPAFAADGDLTGAQRCLTEADRAISAIDATHSGMAWSWVTTAAVACGFRDAAARACSNAVKAIEVLQGQGAWEFDNAVFWAAAAARTANDEESTRALLVMFTENPRVPGRNQYLQAAAVLGAKEALREIWQRALDSDAPTLVRDGNLALALADGGMTEELLKFLDVVVAREGPRGEDDTQKRYAWALAIAGDFDGALAHVPTIGDAEERVRALDRVVAVAVARKRDDVLAEAKRIARKLTRTTDWRIQALLAQIYFALNDRQEAIRLAEEVVRQGIVPSQWNTVAFRKQDSLFSQIVGVAKSLFKLLRRDKTGRRPLRTDIGSLSDVKEAEKIVGLIRNGNRDEALQRLSDIRVPRLRWEALKLIAESMPDAPQAMTFWRDALLESRLVSEPSVRETVAGLMAKLPDSDLRDRLLGEVRKINVRWIEAGFEEQYESMRTSLRSGPERTRLLEGLMVLKTRRVALKGPQAIDLGWWNPQQVKELIQSGSAGKRAFALAVMESDVGLAQFDVVLDMIPNSLSAFEQYHSLKVMQQLVGKSTAKERRRLQRVLAAERRHHIEPGTDREKLARAIEQAIALIESGDKT